MTGSIQIKNGKYYAVINTYVNGKRKPKWIATGLTVKGSNKRKAEAFLRQKLIDLESDEKTTSSDILFTDYLEKWLKNQKISISEITFNGYEWISDRHIIPYFKERGTKLNKLSKDDIQEYINYKFEHGRLDGKGGLSPKSIKEQKNIIQSVLNSAVEDGLIYKNPCQNIKIPAATKKDPKFYNKKQLCTLFDAIKNEPLFPFLYITSVLGLRRSEALGLKWDCIDFERKMITIQHTVVKYRKTVSKDITKTKTSHRSYPMSPKIEKLLKDLKKEENKNSAIFKKEYIKNNYIFKWPNGEPYSPDFVTDKFGKLLKKYNLPHIRLHDLRHSCASVMLENDYQLKDIQEWLGHADIQTTANIYSHIDIARKKKIADSLDKDFG